MIAAGDVVAADARVIDSDGLAVDESALTGGPVSAAKGSAAVAADTPLAERSSMLYAATAVVAGAGEALIVAVGADSEIGRLRQLVDDAKAPATPLQGAMAELARAALMLAIAASVLVPLLGVLRGQSPRQMLLDGLTLAFATIPEELPILVTVLVAVGGLRLAKQGVLLRKLRAAEAVGAITVLLSDKTGTLTDNRLELALVDGDRDRVLDAAVAAHGGAPAQDPLDRALQHAARPQPTPSRARRFAFDPVRRRESAVTADKRGVRVYVKGAPEAVLAVSTISISERDRVLSRVAQLADDGLRVIAVAHRDTGDDPPDALAAEQQLELLGLVAFRDPLRDGVTDAVGALARAGVRTIVVSGDHPRTVCAVARQAGLRDVELLLGGADLRRRRRQRCARAGGRERRHRDGSARHRPCPRGRRPRPHHRCLSDDRRCGRRRSRARSATAPSSRVLPRREGRAGDGDRGSSWRSGLPAPFEPVHIVLLELFMDLGASVAFVAEPPAADAMRQPPRDPSRPFLDRAQVAAIGLTAVALTARRAPRLPGGQPRRRDRGRQRGRDRRLARRARSDRLEPARTTTAGLARQCRVSRMGADGHADSDRVRADPGRRSDRDRAADARRARDHGRGRDGRCRAGRRRPARAVFAPSPVRMSVPDDLPPDLNDATAQRRREDALLAELTEPDLDEARESHMYWLQRLDALPHHRRVDRREAQEMVTRWKQRVDEARRARYGLGLLEQALTALNIAWRPNPRRLIKGLTIVAMIALVLVVALIIAIVVFWSELEPIIRLFIGANDADGGG